ncbi:phenylalanine--tRNA ligase subunit alpha [Granulicella arctica]|uniref:Phenylalanine--tRNA ligase alpha subunit n=1 Tax=Granulicella arctica TaxID=940613 RepID=A0A7Y9PH83_9BACT|nr:phenylalanine--tRNA ligase subunit alpha [Granulicella arctica]NYF79083.1 phenylalanyl-tRNA synthetase alpha chain [Granulicella arctica]
MTDAIPTLLTYDEPALDAAFATLAAEARATPTTDPEAFRLHWLGRKQGRLKLVSEAWLKSAPPEAKKALGIRFNQLKQQIEAALEAPAASAAPTRQGIDITLPGATRTPGIPHPLLKTMHEIVAVFHHLGYSTNLGPQVESDFYNFEALNFPPNHPARDTQDTLVIAAQQNRPARDRLLMRTHTSPVQIRTMIAQAPPIRIVIPGKVHRNDAADATHSPIFHQIEGLCVDTNITFSDLKGTLDHAMKALFGSAVKTRFFPSFFPFTEPSADVQISCIFCNGKGCRKCKHSGWIELLGCGMVDPAVFAAVTEERRKINPADDAYNPEKITGFAFGMGVERIAMIQHGISDIGHFYSGDMRFLEQFA